MNATHGYGEMVNVLHTLWEDGERVFSRARRPADGGDRTRLIAQPAVEQPAPASLDRLAHEFELKDELDGAWAVRPLELVREGGETLLVLEDPGGEPLERLIGAPMAVGRAVRLAVGIAAALGKLHQRGLIHKDLRPAHILVNCTDGQPRLTGFGIASQLRRERQTPEPPETLAGTLAYMAPEQTGRMNRSIEPAAICMPSASRSTRCSRVRCRSPQPIRWSGCTAISRESRCRPASGYALSRLWFVASS